MADYLCPAGGRWCTVMWGQVAMGIHFSYEKTIIICRKWASILTLDPEAPSLDPTLQWLVSMRKWVNIRIQKYSGSLLTVHKNLMSKIVEFIHFKHVKIVLNLGINKNSIVTKGAVGGGSCWSDPGLTGLSRNFQEISILQSWCKKDPQKSSTAANHVKANKKSILDHWLTEAERHWWQEVEATWATIWDVLLFGQESLLFSLTYGNLKGKFQVEQSFSRYVEMPSLIPVKYRLWVWWDRQGLTVHCPVQYKAEVPSDETRSQFGTKGSHSCLHWVKGINKALPKT